MEKKNQSDGIKRRTFLQTGAMITASTLFLPLGGYKVFGAPDTTQTKSSMPMVIRNNGIAIPMLGFGTHSLKGALCVRCVSEAVSAGYRIIDIATIYGNEEFVGEGIRHSGIDREKLFVTSKFWMSDSSYETTKQAFETSLKKLGLEYFDLNLIHRP